MRGVMLRILNWKNDDELLIYASGTQGLQLYEWNVRNGAEKTLDSSFFTADGHCSYSPDGRYILYDSYPDSQKRRHLYLYDLRSRQKFCPGSLYSHPGDVEVRCDLHPRWNRAGDAISLDSTHEGARHIYEVDLSALCN